MNRKSRRAKSAGRIHPTDEASQMEALLVKCYREILRAQPAKEQAAAGEEELRAVRLAAQKEMTRAAFLSVHLATEEDFERLWPRLFDDQLCILTNAVHSRVLAALNRQLDREERQ